jgi:hypothetical protein
MGRARKELHYRADTDAFAREQGGDMSAMTESELEHIAENGDVYDAMETCDDLRQKLSRLCRMHVITNDDYRDSRNIVEEVRQIVEAYLDEPR